MAHGFGATKDAGLEPFAERFQAAGADVLVFDYRGFGTSDGDVRQDVNHRTHRQDYVAAVDHARTIEGVDPQRIFLWGSSYSGGHVIAVAARDKAIAGVISQGAAMDGLAAVAMILGYAGPRQLLKLTGHSLRDVGRAITRRTPHMIPIVGPPKSLAAITSDDGESGYAKIMGPTFVNEMRARGIMRIMANRPVTKARRLRMPVFLDRGREGHDRPGECRRTGGAQGQGLGTHRAARRRTLRHLRRRAVRQVGRPTGRVHSHRREHS